MAERLAGGNQALALLGNTLPTGAILYVLITALGPVSGCHLNPAVTLALVLRRNLSARLALAYVAAQVVGAITGVLVAHGMFELAPLSWSTKLRTGPAQWLAEAVATFGLVGTILGTARFSPERVPLAVGLYIIAAYWFTASTSFANPAVTLARSLTDTFSGIAPAHVAAFCLAQIAGAVLASLGCAWLYGEPQPSAPVARQGPAQAEP